MSNFDINSAPMPWVKPREVPQGQAQDINLNNIDTLYGTQYNEDTRPVIGNNFEEYASGEDATPFDTIFNIKINDLNQPNEGYFVNEKNGAKGYNSKDKKENKVADDAKYFYMGLVTGGSIDDLERTENDDGTIEYALENQKNKDFICSQMGISEEEYDAMACIALALASQETGMGYEVGDSLKDPGYQKENTSWFYKTLRNAGIKGANLLEKISRGGVEAHSASSGLTQLKIFDHMESTEFVSKWYTNYLEHLGIEATSSTEDNLYDNPDLAAAATMITLTSLLKHHSSYEATMKVYHENLRKHINEEYGVFSDEALEKGYNHVIDIYEKYESADSDTKEKIRYAMKHWLLSTDGSTVENKSEDGEAFTEEIQLNNLNKYLELETPLTQESLDFIRYFLTDENMTMSKYEYLPYAWNKGTSDQPDRVMADQMGLILSEPEIYDYDQHTANVVALAEKYADQATGGDGYYAIKDTLEAYKKQRWYE